MSKIQVIIALCIALAGCTSSMVEDLPVLRYQAESGPSSGTVVLMRGIGGSHKTFEKRGWIDEIRNRGFDWTLIAPDAGLSYYMKRTLVARLTQDVVAPSMTTGHEKVWFAGVSMGGLGSLYYLLERPNEVAGVVLIAPYLGSPEIMTGIQAAGGLIAWQPPNVDPPDDWEWSFLRSLRKLLLSEDHPPIYLAYGLDDKHRSGQRLLADALPKENVITLPGKHRKWVFDRLWTEILDHKFISLE